MSALSGGVFDTGTADDDSAEEQDETPFDETRLAYSGAEEGDGDVDVQELEEAGARLDDPERETPPTDR